MRIFFAAPTITVQGEKRANILADREEFAAALEGKALPACGQRSDFDDMMDM